MKCTKFRAVDIASLPTYDLTNAGTHIANITIDAGGDYAPLTLEVRNIVINKATPEYTALTGLKAVVGDVPTPDEPTPVVPTPDVPTPDEPTPVVPTPDVPTPVDPTPVDPTPVVPTPDVPTPDVPTPDEPTPDVPKPAGLLGDANGDGVVDSADALAILRNSADLGEFDDTQKLLSDVDGDGVITAGDALEVLRYSAQLSANENIGKPVTQKAA